MNMVPTQFVRIAALEPEIRNRYDLSSMRRVLHGSAPCPIPAKQAMFDLFGPIIWETYGGMEGLATIGSPEDWLAHPGTVGRAATALGIEVVILDDNGKEFRRIYFWRNTLRTLEEIRTTLNRLNKEQAFRTAMDREQPDVREAFKQLKRTLNRASREFLSNLRNELGGHLDEDAMRETLQQLDADAEGFLEVAPAVAPTVLQRTFNSRYQGRLVVAPGENSAPEAPIVTFVATVPDCPNRGVSVIEPVVAGNVIMPAAVNLYSLPARQSQALIGEMIATGHNIASVVTVEYVRISARTGS
jgi:acyl-CoA synthetase (AMP-forming)/AMP-acid ligase II